MLPNTFQELIRHFVNLPSIGPKMAERLTLFVFKQSKEDIISFSHALEALTKLSSCKRCYAISDQEYCSICRDPKRDTTILCVVEDALDAIAIERTGVFSGRYHILGGVIEPGKNKKQIDAPLTVSDLLQRTEKENIQEILLATNPTSEGDLTALYIRQQLNQFPHIRISRIARGLATGGDIEHADEQTLISSLQNRRYYESLSK
ncbi:MAG: recombination protein RecR [Candidatus Moraniibacteriota bacterium]|nr:MAG: recombination protein RecR [Candidatus Moranbacteria bacterium]